MCARERTQEREGEREKNELKDLRCAHRAKFMNRKVIITGIAQHKKSIPSNTRIRVCDVRVCVMERWKKDERLAM